MSECTHPEEKLQPAMLARDARYCPGCQSLIFDDGTVERVQITGIRTYK
jgi:hypothetical protein